MKPFYMVMRLSKSSEEVQQIDSLPHKKYPCYNDAWNESARLCALMPNAAGFVVLKCVGGCATQTLVRTVPIVMEVAP